MNEVTYESNRARPHVKENSSLRPTEWNGKVAMVLLRLPAATRRDVSCVRSAMPHAAPSAAVPAVALLETLPKFLNEIGRDQRMRRCVRASLDALEHRTCTRHALETLRYSLSLSLDFVAHARTPPTIHSEFVTMKNHAGDNIHVPGLASSEAAEQADVSAASINELRPRPMAAVEARALLLTAVLAALVAPSARAARFGDRLAPRVPAAYAPRNAPAAHQYAEADYDESYEQEYDEQNPSVEEDDPSPKTEPPPRRPARTEAHRLEMSTEYFVIPDRTSSSTPPPTSSKPLTSSLPTEKLNTTSIVATQPATGSLRHESWAVPILALACVTMVTLGGFEAFVIWGARRKAPSHRHLLLGQCLLFGLFTCAATAALYATTPTVFTCGAVRFGTGVAYVIVFASLLVKCVFLLSLNGGVYLPAAYQGLLLFFAVMIQVAIGAQWLGGSPPRVVRDGARCDSQLSDMLLSLCYAAFLIAVVCGVALRSRGIRDNYREATHIAGAGGAAAAVWVCWVAAALGAPERHRDACVAAGLLATCAVVFALMFAPKGRRLAALGREGRWDADRDEGLSSLGAGGSGYSPSFFHFKPVKYGMVTAAAPAPAPPPALDRKDAPAQPAGVMVRPEEGNVYTSVEPTFSSNPNVYFHRTDPLHAGMMY
ncbi:unnamed protein product [Chilo suppressalis]|uniref:G-protein coupled receptors family 3 profile domain-containing protein n=1 Tax=Chilo suppressalis TaxID=168631 RepID=A0ABN8ATN0_CHISP|nr:unnamed protein product [Chilo suppressalis]